MGNVAPTVKHRSRSGRIAYRVDGNPAFPEGLWGFEEFRMTQHADGMRVMRAYCELHDDPPLVRDVVQSVDADFHPLESYVRLTASDRFQGSAWYRFTDTEATLHGHAADSGPFTECTDITRAMRGFGSHNLTSDGWLTARYDFSQGPGLQSFENNLLTSKDHRGATGPGFERTNSALRYSGVEDVDVAAGRFRCHHFAITATSHGHPPYDFWVTADGDFLYVKGVVTEPYNWSFELTAHDGDAPEGN